MSDSGDRFFGLRLELRRDDFGKNSENHWRAQRMKNNALYSRFSPHFPRFGTLASYILR